MLKPNERELFFFVLGGYYARFPKQTVHWQRAQNVSSQEYGEMSLICSCTTKEAKLMLAPQPDPRVRCLIHTLDLGLDGAWYEFRYAAGRCQHCGSIYLLHNAEGVEDSV